MTTRTNWIVSLSGVHSQFLSQVRLEVARHNSRDAARHENVPVGLNLNLNLSAGAVHRQLVIHMPQLVCGARRRATAAPRRQRVSGASLPNLNLDVPPVNDFQQLNVNLIRKQRMSFHRRSQLERQFLRYFLHRDDTVRVAHRRTRHFEFLFSHLQGFVRPLRASLR